MLRLRMAAAAIAELKTSLNSATTAANETTKATKAALSEHEKLRTSMQDNAPLISGYYDMLDQLITVLRFSDDAIKRNSAANQIEAVTDIIRKLGGSKEGGELFDLNAYIASKVKELEAAAKRGGSSPGTQSTASQQSNAGRPQNGGGLRIGGFMPRPATPTTPTPPPNPSTGVLPS